MRMRGVWLALGVSVLTWGVAAGQEGEGRPSSYSPVVMGESFAKTYERLSAEREAQMAAHMALLAERYDLSDRPLGESVMTRGKAVQGGVRARLAAGVSWSQLATMSAEEIRERKLFPAGFLPLMHPRHEEGGMLFPAAMIELIGRQEQRDLKRFDLDFDLPEHLLPEFPPPIFLTTRPDLGDVSQGKVVTLSNYFELFDGILNPKQLEGLRLLLTPFPQQQFNATDDRRSKLASFGVSCLDCHVNGHTNAATHLSGDVRPQALRRRIDTPSLRGVNVQRLLGSQRALKSVEDFTEFEQRAAYFDGDPLTAARKGVNVLERGSQVHAMAEFQNLLTFPPAEKLDVFGMLEVGKASEAELRGQAVFFGKARCGACHPAPYYTDGSMHDLRVERFHGVETIAGRTTEATGPIKTPPLRGIKDSPPYLHDGRLLTLEDSIEFFNLVLGLQLDEREKEDLLAFLLAL